MAILSVTQGLVEVEGGTVFELDSSKGLKWLESVKSFRYEPSGQNKPYTARKETGKGGDYWYGYRKQNGKLHKKYIGRSSEVYTGKLEEIAEALNTPSRPQVAEKVTDKTQAKVTDKNILDRLNALESLVESLQQSLEELRKSLPTGSLSAVSEEDAIPHSPNIAVTDKELGAELPKNEDNQLLIELHRAVGNLRIENENLRQECKELRSQLEQVHEEKATVETALAEAAKPPQLPDLKIVYEAYKKEKRPGRLFTIRELKPFYAAILKGLTPDKGS